MTESGHTWDHPDLRGIRIGAIEDTRSCPAVSVCKCQKDCLLGDGDESPIIKLILRDATGVGPEITCMAFKPAVVKPESA